MIVARVDNREIAVFHDLNIALDIMGYWAKSGTLLFEGCDLEIQAGPRVIEWLNDRWEIFDEELGENVPFFLARIDS